MSLVPAREALHSDIRCFPTRITNNPFVGDPRPELHAAWHHLLRSTYEFQTLCRIVTYVSLDDNIRVPTSDLEALNLTSVYLKDGSYGVASLSVYHALHCVVCIR